MCLFIRYFISISFFFLLSFRVQIRIHFVRFWFSVWNSMVKKKKCLSIDLKHLFYTSIDTDTTIPNELAKTYQSVTLHDFGMFHVISLVYGEFCPFFPLWRKVIEEIRLSENVCSTVQCAHQPKNITIYKKPAVDCVFIWIGFHVNWTKQWTGDVIVWCYLN